MNAKSTIALLGSIGYFLSSALVPAGEADIAIRGLMSMRQLFELEKVYTELSTLNAKDPLQGEDRLRYEKCLTSIKEENERRKRFFELIRVGDNLANYPGILEKLHIGYDSLSVKEPDAYEMFVYPSVSTNDHILFMWIRVDLRGNVLKKVIRNTAAD